MTIAEQLKIKEFPFEIKDSNNNIIYYEYSGGYWYKKEFDSNNNIIYYEDSGGYWYKREFDSNNNEIYCENSNGYIEDNRPKPNCSGKIVEVDGVKYKLEELK